MSALHKIAPFLSRQSNPELGIGGSDALYHSGWMTMARMRWERGFPNPRLPQRGNQNRRKSAHTPQRDGAARHTGIRKSPLRFAPRAWHATGRAAAIRHSNPQLGIAVPDIHRTNSAYRDAVPDIRRTIPECRDAVLGLFDHVPDLRMVIYSHKSRDFSVMRAIKGHKGRKRQKGRRLFRPFRPFRPLKTTT